MEITYKYIDKKSTIQKQTFMKKDEKEYFNSKYGYIDLSGIGIKNIEMKARVLNAHEKRLYHIRTR